MKKLIFLLAAVFALSITAAEAQKKSKDKEVAETEESLKLQRLLASENFQFNPSAYTTRTGGNVNIIQYQYMRVRPGQLQIDMDKPGGSLKLDATTFELIKNEKSKDRWTMILKGEANSSIITFNIQVSLKSGNASVRVDSNREDSYTYRGKIAEN